jgi:hypothetical protein
MMLTQYKGAGFVDETPDWQPATQALRRKILEEEKKHINKFWITDMPGYALFTISPARGEVILNYYNGFSVVPFERVNLTALQMNPPA